MENSLYAEDSEVLENGIVNSYGAVVSTVAAHPEGTGFKALQLWHFLYGACMLGCLEVFNCNCEGVS